MRWNRRRFLAASGAAAVGSLASASAGGRPRKAGTAYARPNQFHHNRIQKGQALQIAGGGSIVEGHQPP